ncbi:competence protein ComK [Bacillus sp. JJ722]|uniref:competence protein ComK n=1 Tax=Bacillus sp. JJ722 TaxID=3122973 RepID=UPI002FFFE733
MKKVLNIREEYEITPYTLMVRPIEHEGNLCSQIFELYDEFIVLEKPITIIKTSCEYFGSSYEGRREGTRNLTGYTHKAPIVIDQSSSIFFFPTTSPAKESCEWVAHNHIDIFMKDHNNETVLIFSNKQKIQLSVSYSTFETQVARTAMLKTKLDQRIAETRWKYRIWQKHPTDNKH